MATNELDRVRALVAPIADDLDLDLYDVERQGPTVRVTLDTPAGSEAGISLDTLSLATRLISREIDHEDPIHGSFTLEVTSPGLERKLRTATHFRREVGKPITLRLSGRAVEPGEQRRLDGTLVGATDTEITVVLESGDERVVAIDHIDKARTVFEWGPSPKPGKQSKPRSKGATNTQSATPVNKEKQQS